MKNPPVHNPSTPLTIEKLVFGGQGMARMEDGKIAFVWNALPGEVVDVEIIKKDKHFVEAIATHIKHPSPDRIEPKEPDFLSSSPWQIMSFEKEQYWKRLIAAETYSKIGDLIIQPDSIDIVTDGNDYGYRNKIEFSFCELPDKTISLAFFERGKKNRMPVHKSCLAEPVINEVAQKILSWINEVRIPLRSLKSLIVRSAHNKEAIAALFIKDELAFDSFPSIDTTLLGFHLYYSTHKSPASVPTKLLYSAGQNFLTSTLKGTKLKFGLLSFFQINTPVFDMALTDIASFTEPKTPLIDYYAGVGAISLPISLNRSSCILIDNNEEAIQYATENIALNAREHCTAVCSPAEDMASYIASDKTIILDPPRAGLHQKLITHLLIKKPKRIIYLSCGIDTQARDLRLLSEAYRISFLRLYNFFPRTPHIEGLVVLDRQS